MFRFGGSHTVNLAGSPLVDQSRKTSGGSPDCTGQTAGTSTVPNHLGDFGEPATSAAADWTATQWDMATFTTAVS